MGRTVSAAGVAELSIGELKRALQSLR